MCSAAAGNLDGGRRLGACSRRRRRLGTPVRRRIAARRSRGGVGSSGRSRRGLLRMVAGNLDGGGGLRHARDGSEASSAEEEARGAAAEEAQGVAEGALSSRGGVGSGRPAVEE